MPKGEASQNKTGKVLQEVVSFPEVLKYCRDIEIHYIWETTDKSSSSPGRTKRTITNGNIILLKLKYE